MVDDEPAYASGLEIRLGRPGLRRRLQTPRVLPLRPPRALREAVAPVLADVARTRPEAAFRLQCLGSVDRLVWALREPDGSATGLQLCEQPGTPDAVADLAEQVQEVVQEASPRLGLSSAWPRCLEHPTTHPAVAVVRGSTAVWECPRGGGRAVPVGDLEPDR